MTMFAACVAAALLSTAPPDPGAPGDVERIRAHLARVEQALREADVSALEAGPRAARAHLLDVLHAYRERGLFPHNHVVARRNPVFIDPHGTPCAVGQLIIESGAREVALEISRTQNLASLKDITHPAVAPWAKAHGFTLDELARIQPSYSCDARVDCVVPRAAGEARSVVRLSRGAAPVLLSGLDLPAGVTVLAAASAHDGSGTWVLLSSGQVLSRDGREHWAPRLEVKDALDLAVLDAQHVVVLGADQRLHTFDGATGQRLLVAAEPPTASAVLAVARGELWVTGAQGTFRLRGAKPWQRMGEPGQALSGAADDVWVTTRDGGAFRFDGAAVEDMSLPGQRLESLLALGDGRAAAISQGMVMLREPGQPWGRLAPVPEADQPQRVVHVQAASLTRAPDGAVLVVTEDGALLRQEGTGFSPVALPTARLIHAALPSGDETLLFVQSSDSSCDRYEHPCGGCESPGSCGTDVIDDVRRPPLPCSAAGSAWSWAAVVAAALFTALHRRRTGVAP